MAKKKSAHPKEVGLRPQEVALLAYRTTAEALNAQSQSLLKKWRERQSQSLRAKDAFIALRNDAKLIEALQSSCDFEPGQVCDLVERAVARIRPQQLFVGEYSYATAHEAAFRLGQFVIHIWEQSNAEDVLDFGPKKSNAYLESGEHTEHVLESVRRLHKDAAQFREQVPADLWDRLQHEYQIANDILNQELPKSSRRKPTAMRERGKVGRSALIETRLTYEQEDAILDQWYEWDGLRRIEKFAASQHPDKSPLIVEAAIKHAKERRRAKDRARK